VWHTGSCEDDRHITGPDDSAHARSVIAMVNLSLTNVMPRAEHAAEALKEAQHYHYLSCIDYLRILIDIEQQYKNL
jgi:hypothetical protein